MKTSLLRRAAFCALLAGTCLTAPAAAQMPGSVPAPPVRQNIDDNGVDVIRGTFNTAQTPLSIGPDAENGFAYTFQSFNAGYRDGFQAFLTSNGSTYTVTLNGASETFTYNGSAFESTEGSGATLTGPLGFLTFTARDGTTATFQLNTSGAPFYDAPQYRPLEVVRPNGLRTSYRYKNQTFCTDQQVNENDVPYCPAGKLRTAQRLQGVHNSNGYMLKFSYGSDTMDLYTYGTDYSSWSNLVSVRAVNNASEYCDSSADSCSLTQSWPTASFLRIGNQNTVTDSGGRATRYTNDSSNRVTAIKRPGASSDNVTIAYGASGVSSITRDGVAYTYGYVDSGAMRTTTVTDALGKTRKYLGDTANNLLKEFTNELNQKTIYAHDPKGRVTRVTAPEGNYVEYEYDDRGNVKKTTNVAKVGSGLANIVTSAAFDASCANPKTCNKPITTTDAAGAVTDYTYDGTHGGMLTVTLPAPTSGAVRPQTRYAYSGVQGYYRQAPGGSPAASGQTTYLLSGTSACQNNASCVGTADEAKATIAYGPQSAGTPNNLLPVSSSAGAGDGSLTATVSNIWDAIGNRTHVDGPLAGTADTTRTIYNGARQVIGVIGPDPDGGGALKYRARKWTYNSDGQVTLAEQGTTNGQSDGDWAGFTRLLGAESGYDGNGRRWFTRSIASDGTTSAYVRHGYDSLGREICVALRMNPAIWPETTQDPCQQASAGSYGPDRITRSYYDDAGRIISTASGFNTAEAGSDGAVAFTNNGKVQTFTDGEGRITTFEYDGFDRLLKTRYPLTSGSGSSTTDYEGLTYDNRSNVTQRRLRDTQTIGYVYDALSRQTSKDAPGSSYYDTDITYAYDLMGRLKTATSNYGDVVSFGFDALGRQISETGHVGTRTMQYDLAGQLSRLTWQDGFFVTYGRNHAGQVSEIRENGSALLAAYGYDDLGRRTTLVRGNGAVTGYSYDSASRLTDVSQNLAGTAADVSWTIGFNPAGQITSRTRNNDSYAFTGLGNLDALESVNGLNQITAQGATSVKHDARGNVVIVGGAAFGYTSENRMNSAAGLQLAYDAMGRHFYLSTSPTTLYFDHVGDQLIGEWQSGALTKRYVHGSGTDEPLVWYEGSGTATKRYFHADERGSVVAVSDASGNVVGINKYDEYGQPQGAVTGRFGYTGQVWLPEIGLHYYKARMYHAGIGRFMQTDPVGYAAGQNLYGYVSGDPVNLVDPTGMAYQATDNDHVKPIDPTIVVNGWICYACGQPDGYLDKNPGAVFGAGPGSGGDGGVDGPDIVVEGERLPPIFPDVPPLVIPLSDIGGLMNLPSASSFPESGQDQCGGGDRLSRNVPDSPLGRNVSSACQRHDSCYDASSSKSRLICDAGFYLDVISECKKAGGSASVCDKVGALYFLGVRFGGRQNYQGKGSNDTVSPF